MQVENEVESQIWHDALKICAVVTVAYLGIFWVYANTCF